MKNKLFRISRYFAVGLLIFSMSFAIGCSGSDNNRDPFANNESNDDSNHNNDSHLGGILALIGGLLGNNGEETPATREYLYVNNDAQPQNYVSAFSINTDGTLIELAGSPYATNGKGGGESFAINPIALAPTKRLLFALNIFDNTITVFGINNNDGTLAIIGAPVSSGGLMAGTGSLVVSNDENYLFVSNKDTNNISVFTINSTGGLTAVTGSPFNIGGEAYGMTLNLSGNILYVADPNNNILIVLNVAGDGSLSPIAGSPFAYTAYSSRIVSFAVSSSTIGIAGDIHGVLSSYSIDATGAPTLLNVLDAGVANSQCVTTARNGSIAIMSGGGRDFISVANVAADGSMTLVAGSPFAAATYTGNYAVANPEGTFLYATEESQLEGFSIGANGALTSLGTFPITNGPAPSGIVIFTP